jgi:hypothetical protein
MGKLRKVYSRVRFITRSGGGEEETEVDTDTKTEQKTGLVMVVFGAVLVSVFGGCGFWGLLQRFRRGLFL